MNKQRKVIGWIVTIVACLAPAWGVIGKFISPEMQANMASIGFEPYTQMVAIFELIAVAFFILPQTGRIGALLMTALMAGAVAAHLGHGQNIGFQTTILCLIWTATLIRYPEFLRFRAKQES
ncbi:DoxX family protein [uncultured Polaribacter sp.]|uniref:DoxX family protein n=1 Tax=uncultured Polaribacter sp. TaxID=174711 RepID=UPI0026140ED9|nr:DoxX family protein [uncultured Polaribacter sp.]